MVNGGWKKIAGIEEPSDMQEMFIHTIKSYEEQLILKDKEMKSY